MAGDLARSGMRLYTCTGAPNPRRVAAYLVEKNLDIPTQAVSLREGEHLRPPLSDLNPDRTLPFLVLDEGTLISESVAICRYLELCHPEPPMFGRDAREVGLAEMWLRRLELQLYQPVQDAYRNSRPGFAGRALPGHESGVKQIPELVARSNATFKRTLGRLEAALEGGEFLIGETPTMADIVGFTSIAFARRTKMVAASDTRAFPNVEAWVARMEARPSGSAGVARA